MRGPRDAREVSGERPVEDVDPERDEARAPRRLDRALRNEALGDPDVAIAFELGAQGVLLNTGVALAQDPVRMARAMRDAVAAGREAFLAGRMPRRRYANASSPLDGLFF